MEINKILPYPININISYTKKQGSCIITWSPVIKPNDENILEIGYNVYRSTSINGIYYKQNQKPLISNAFEDSNRGINPNTVYWYKVSTIYIDQECKFIEGETSPPVTYKVNNTNRWFNKMNERNMWILKNDGQLFDLYTIKTEGKKCACYSENHGNASNSNCQSCFGTGFEGGYEPMVQIYVRQKPAQTSLDLSNGGLRINNAPGAWTISDIHIKNRDILINPQGIIFQVISSNINHSAGVYFHQELQLKEIPPTDVLYKMKREILYPNF